MAKKGCEFSSRDVAETWSAGEAEDKSRHLNDVAWPAGGGCLCFSEAGNVSVLHRCPYGTLIISG